MNILAWTVQATDEIIRKTMMYACEDTEWKIPIDKSQYRT